MAQSGFQVTTADKERIVTGSQTFDKQDHEIFLNAMLWTIERGTQLKELISDCDFEKLRLTLDYNIIQEEATSFASKLTIQVSQGRLVYLVSDIKGQQTGLGGMLGAVQFNKMNPEKKPKQKQMVEEFEQQNKKILQSLLEFVGSTKTDLTFWQQISEGKLEKGMSKTDVMLILGKPIDIQTASGTTQMMYNSFTYVFLEEGKVKSFMQ